MAEKSVLLREWKQDKDREEVKSSKIGVFRFASECNVNEDIVSRFQIVGIDVKDRQPRQPEGLWL
jgi:hypothetical protein